MFFFISLLGIIKRYIQSLFKFLFWYIKKRTFTFIFDHVIISIENKKVNIFSYSAPKRWHTLPMHAFLPLHYWSDTSSLENGQKMKLSCVFSGQKNRKLKLSVTSRRFLLGYLHFYQQIFVESYFFVFLLNLVCCSIIKASWLWRNV